MRFNRVSHDPHECRRALAHARLATIDTETTGVARRSRIVSVALKVGLTIFVLFRRSLVIPNLSEAALRRALEPLARRDLVLLLHNAPFDLEKLRREGVVVGARVIDSLRLLRLIDNDRLERFDLRRPPLRLNYRLKPVCRVRYGIDPPEEFAAGTVHADTLPYERHVRYVVSDLLLTERLARDLWRALPPPQRDYYLDVCEPLIDVMLAMRQTGFSADPGFINQQSAKLDELLRRLSRAHRDRFGLPLGLSEQQTRDWLFGRLRLPTPPRNSGQKTPKAPLDAEALRWLLHEAETPQQRGSLRLLADYRRVASLLRNLRTPLKHVDRANARWHPQYDDRQASGRISSTIANLQQISKRARVHGVTVAPRNMMVAPPGHVLVAVDVSQADVRILAHMAEAFPRSTRDHLHHLDESADCFPGRRWLRDWRQYLAAHLNPHYQAARRHAEPDYYPFMTKVLADTFRGGGDFYTEVAIRILKRKPQNKAERNRAKTLILATINGQGPKKIAEELGCSRQQARQYQSHFYADFPDVAAYKALMNRQIAMTGRVESFLGRPRAATVHRWLVAERVVEVLVTYRGRDQLWLRIVPLRASLRVLTCVVIEAIDANRHSPNFGRRIYHHKRGRLSSVRYRLFYPPRPMLYRMPVRNIAWRSIRRVRTATETARYPGFDKTARQLFNHIAQAGTADLVKAMMLRVQPVCGRVNARLILQVHDELVFEVPEMPRPRWRAFLSALRGTLRQPPAADFRVPVGIEVKVGRRFGEL
jgi:DNA polymerase I-like protein with 3'-5' exonuclease and polymerase domains